jgi:hypothetical protein
VTLKDAPRTSLRPTAAIADVRQDIAGAVPSQLVDAWLASERDDRAHEIILRPYEVEGTIVSSDSVGLSKLTRTLAQAQVLALVSQPKERLYALASAVGGEAIGVWAADNAQLFFRSEISANVVVEQMLAALAEIRSCAVQVGLAVHSARCFRVAGGLFGAEADLVEHLAEDVSRGGEILLTRAARDALSPGLASKARRCEPDRSSEPLWSLLDVLPERFVAGEDVLYPAPFSEDVRTLLRASSIDALAHERLDRWRREAVVVFLHARPGPRKRLLDGFAQLAALDRVVASAASAGGDAIKSTGSLAIVLFSRASDAIGFATASCRALRADGVRASAAVTQGDVFVFDLGPERGREIAGDPVNLGAKLAEDAGYDGVLVEAALASDPRCARGEPFSLELSGLVLEGRLLDGAQRSSSEPTM